MHEVGKVLGGALMSNRTRKVNLLIFALIIALTFSVQAYGASKSRRLKGNNRYETAVAISKEGWPEGSGYVILATGDDYPDALSAAPLAKKYNAPILLTGKNSLDSNTASAIRNLKAQNVIIIGGTGVISQPVEDQLRNMMGLKVERIAGSDRYETAIKVAMKLGSSKNIAVVTGNDFSDALSIAPIASKKAMPIILVAGSNIPEVVKDYIKGKNFDRVYIIGSYNDISSNMDNAFPNAVRIAGTDKYERNVNVLKTFEDEIDFDTVYVATGEDYPDALSASVLAAQKSNAVILTENWVPWAVRDFMKSRVISNIVLLGGTGVLSSNAESTLVSLPAKVLSIDTISVEVSQNEKYVLPKTVTVELDNGTKCEIPVDWGLASVDTSKPGERKVLEGTIKGYSGKAKLILTIKPAVSTIENITAEVIEGDEFNFPSTVRVKFTDGTIEDYPVKWSAPTVSMNKTGSYPIQGQVEGIDKKATLKLVVSEDQAIEINDRILKRIICHELDKPITSTIYKSDLLSIESLESYGSGTIESLDGLQYMTNLRELELNGYSIVNITNIQNLTNLDRLDLGDNDIENISPLQKLTWLRYLDLSDNRITDIKVLKNLTGLKYLYLDGNRKDGVWLTDFSPVRSYYSNLRDSDFDYDDNDDD